MENKKMKASELRKKLKELIEKHGDLEVYYVWYDVEEETADHIEYKEENELRDYPERFLIQ
jgi:hypothetical protein